MAKILEYRVYKLSTRYRKSWHYAGKVNSFDELMIFFKKRTLHSYSTNTNYYKVRCIDEYGEIIPMFYKIIFCRNTNIIKSCSLVDITTIYPFVKEFFNE